MAQTVKYWLSCHKFTIQVDTQDGIIIQAALIVKKFIGQDIFNLVKWMDKFGGFSYWVMEEKDGTNND